MGTFAKRGVPDRGGLTQNLAKTTFRAPKLDRRFNTGATLRGDEAQKRVHTKRCDSQEPNETKGQMENPAPEPEKRGVVAKTA